MQEKLNLKKNTIVIGLIFALAAICVAVLNLRSTATAQSSDDVKAVTDVLNQNAASFVKGDMTMLNKLWANDESVTVFESGHANYGWTDYRDNHLAPEMKEMKNTKYTYSDIKVKVDGKTAWGTMKYAISADIGARHVDGGGLATAVLEKRDGRWQIVHWHSSAPRRPPAPSTNQTEQKKP